MSERERRWPRTIGVSSALILLAVVSSSCGAPSGVTADTVDSKALTGQAADADGPLRAARWVLVPERAEASAEHYDALRAGAALVDGVRVVRRLAGAPEQSQDLLPGTNFYALALPSSNGAGYVFHSEVESEAVFWRADGWTSPLTALTRLPERVDHVQVGFGRVYTRLADSGETVAFDPETGAAVNLGPLPPSPSYFDFQFWDDWFAAVHTDARGVLATFDGGATWHPTGITNEDASLTIERDGILVSTSERRDLLAPDGSWTQNYDGEPADSNVAIESRPRGLSDNPLELAVLHGWPVGKRRAIAAEGGHVGLVDLDSGQLVNLRRSQYQGSQPCHALPFGAGVGLLCLSSSGATTLYAVQEDLSLQSRVSWPGQVELWSNGDHALVARGACPGDESALQPAPHAHCVIRESSPPRTFALPGANGAERLVALRDGRVAVVNPPRTGHPGSLRFVDRSASTPGASETVLKFEAGVSERTRSLVESALWLRDGGELDEGQLGFWVATQNRVFGVKVALDGTVTPSRRTEADLRRTHLSGRRAVELSAGETAWQSLDYGQSWQEFPLPRGLTAASTRETRDVVGCSAVGCSFGNWLRVGYNTVDSVVPKDAELPDLLESRPSAYSQWALTCYPTGVSEGPRQGSSQLAQEQGQGRPRFGTTTGFIGSGLASSAAADIANSANRPFLGVPRPSLAPGVFAFDMGADGAQQFRSYAWGRDGAHWGSSSGWLTRVADRFSVAGLWSTAPTRAPWPNLLSAAQLFGADRANRYSSSWQLSLDPSERAGVLRITTTGTTELHFIEEGGPTVSVGNTSFGPLAGVVKVQKTWYFGTQEGNRFEIYRVRNGLVEEFAHFPVGDPVAPQLTRNTRGTAVALVLRAPAGTWHVYPLSENGEAAEPLVLSRDQLNAEWPRCLDDELGYYVVGVLPLSRFTPNDGSDVLSFEGVPGEWKAEAVTARTVVSDSVHCVEGLAARLASSEEARVLTARVPPKTGTIPLTLTDRLNDVRYGFQCLP